MRITDHAAARAVLSDPSCVPPPVPSGAPFGTLAWLRSQVSRFASGAEHAERRALVEECLSALDPSALRSAAATRADRGAEIMEIPAGVLGEALGIDDTGALVRAVDAAATGYLSGEGTPRRTPRSRPCSASSAPQGTCRAPSPGSPSCCRPTAPPRASCATPSPVSPARAPLPPPGSCCWRPFAVTRHCSSPSGSTPTARRSRSTSWPRTTGTTST
ncbi:hypothetical protein [Nonomuraea recticatena]|uniref:hypothetical protein n=1 Tax=Nonomuraea recticatena TaxID=46178 RepID=UPI00360EC397